MNDASETMQRIEVMVAKHAPRLLRAAAHDEPYRRYQPIPDWLQACIVSRYAAHESITELSTNLEISQVTITKILRQRGVALRRGRRLNAHLIPA